ncbi:hypothetical protein GGD56_001161 [Rhizobium mongolense]|uniref:Uncharacterized protein n=2 Tax=Rhizobium mongolense TaxID=57676 RepID=A0ABR6IHN2_9HYPH|nr:hypothetical protein [Rhizobium mongolense]TVZ74498.1 hypothetical protein BCL32_2887 [Rhizobium mongolense USDA 1844]
MKTTARVAKSIDWPAEPERGIDAEQDLTTNSSKGSVLEQPVQASGLAFLRAWAIRWTWAPRNPKSSTSWVAFSAANHPRNYEANSTNAT